MSIVSHSWACFAILVLGAAVAWGDEQVDFSRDVRPVLARHCLACHGSDEESREAGLRLDDGQAATEEADSGARAIVPGKPDESELIARVTAEDDGQRMPPADAGEALSDAEIAILRRWIEQGAPFAGHWSFVKPERPPLPQVRNSQWPRNEIDLFILPRLEAEQLSPNPPADRYSLVRRLSLDLRGLPPTWSEVEAFVHDDSPDAYEQLVDRMLADPAYGERWALMWLDLARYADSSGYGSDPLRHNMWRYRDWVIDALNRNMPFDQFTIEQLAGDLLPNATLEQRMATAFHRNTMTNTEGGTDDEEFRVAAVKNRVDTTLQVWMGLTMGCAQCHNHKYDPISQEDYYAVFAIFNQTQDADRPDESPTMEAPRDSDLAARRAHQEQLAAREQALSELQGRLASAPPAEDVAPLQGRFVRLELPGPDRILSLAEVEVYQGTTNLARNGRASQVSTDYEGQAERAIDGVTDGDYFAAHSTTHTRSQDDPWWEVDLGDNHLVDRIVIWNRTDNGQEARLAPYRLQLLDAARQIVWQQTVDDPPRPSQQWQPRPLSPLEEQRAALEREIAQLRTAAPKMPTLPVMQQLPPDQHRETHVLIRGDFLTKGQRVVPAVLSHFHPLPLGASADRLGLAQWLVAPDNPLTARVTVNRLWARLFGTGLVSTEEDFGTEGELPTHPALLDWLALRLLDCGWDVKHMLRLMVTSATYRQSARVSPELLERDPDNQWLARAPRLRLEAELVRDQALALSGLLSRRIGGPSVFPYQPPGLWRAAFNGERTWPTSAGEDRYRRGLYTFWRRTVPYPSLMTLDAPSREICTLRRVRTNTPLQALVCLNDPAYVEAAQALARRLLREGGEDVSERAANGLRLCLCRPPTAEEIQVLVELFTEQQTRYQRDPAAARQLAGDSLGPLPQESDAADLAAWTVVANVLLNMDGILTR